MILLETEDWKDFKNEIKNLIKNQLSLSKKEEPSIWVSSEEACNILNVSKATLRNYRLGKGLAYSKIEKQIMYKREDLIEFLNKHYNG